MKRLRLAMAALAMTVLAGVIFVHQGRAQVGPGDQPTVLRTWMDQPATTTSTGGAFSPGAASGPATSNSTAGAFSPGLPAVNPTMPQIPSYQAKADPNQDLFVSKEQGPWLICVTCYSGPQAPTSAREMVTELCDRYKLPAYVFSKRDEERRVEFERVKKIVEDYHKYCVENHLSPDPHFRVRTKQIEYEYAILVGNYPDADVAHRALDTIRNLKPPENKKLCAVALVPELNNPDGKPATTPKSPNPNEKKKPPEPTYLSPFKGAFVVHNPAIKQERPADWDKLDMAVLKRLNRGENFTLLNCPKNKNYTLVVRQFSLPAETRSSTGNIFGKINPFAHQSDIDVQAHNAHNLAELIHKTTHLDAFVLHTKYSSMVTVGAFDSLEDPALRATQEMLKNQYKIPMPVPMAVPK
jgi:hypothetical protein